MMNNATILSSAEGTGANIFAIYDRWITNPAIDIFYKVMTVAIVLLFLGAIPQTRKAAAWISGIVLTIIILTGKAPSSSSSGAPASP